VKIVESGFARFEDSQDGRDDPRSSWKSYNPANPNFD
jgi:hypothetical protein